MTTDQYRRIHFGIGLACLLTGAALLSGCASSGYSLNPDSDLTQPRPVWPPPPEKARISYEKSIYGPRDCEIRLSWWRRTLNVVTGSDSGVERFVQPCAVAVDADGNLCVVDREAHAVSVFQFDKKTANRWTSVGDFTFISPVSIAKQNDVVFVADSEIGKVVAFNMKGEIIFTTGNEMQRPVGLAVSDDNLLVVDVKQHCICVYALDGTFKRKIGVRGVGPGEFNFPTHIAVDTNGLIYITDSMNMRIQILSPSGASLRTIGSVGDGSGHFSRPKGIAVDPFRHIYVVDALFDNVQIFDATGKFLLAWGSQGAGMGEFWLPSGIAINHDNQIFVADAANGRIQRFKYVGDE